MTCDNCHTHSHRVKIDATLQVGVKVDGQRFLQWRAFIWGEDCKCAAKRKSGTAPAV